MTELAAPAASGPWRIVAGRGPTWIRCDALDVPGVAHAFSTRRHAAGHDFDVGAPGDGAAREAARLEFARAAGMGSRAPIVLRQEHGTTLVPAEPAFALAHADGAFAVRSGGPAGLTPAVRTADCVPILIADNRGRAVAAVHAGWRGVAASIAALAVRRLGELGAPAADLRVALGPAIGACCYEVGADVAESVARASGAHVTDVTGRHATSGALTLDLHAALRAQLRGAGVPGDAVLAAPWCTACRGELFFSHRRDRGRTGRHMACIGFVEPA